MNNVGCPVCKMPIESDKATNANRIKQLQTQQENKTENKESIKFNAPKIPEYNKINTYKQILKLKEMITKSKIK
jgi:hypothetical protein